MAFDIEGAKSAGYSDAEIANFLGQQNNFDVAGAKKAGYTDTEILGHLTATPAVKPVAPAVTPETENFSTLRGIADMPLQATKGLVTGIRMISDAFGANSNAGKTLRGAEDYIANLMSAQSKQDSQEVARIMKEAEDKGMLDQIKAGVKAFTVAPIDLLSNALGTAAPAIVASLGAAVLGPAAAITAGVGVGATMGAGTVKGSIYDAVKEELSKTKMPADQIEARAELAQAYNGNNLDMILTGAAIGALGATTGAEPAIARQMSKGIIAKAAIKQEIKDVAEEQLKKAAERGIVKQGAITGAKELGTEFGQAGQEQLAQNLALQREGVDVPTMRGVVGQATLEGLAGLGLGTVAGGREALKAQDVLDQRKLIASEEARLKEEQLKKEQATTPEAKAAAQQNIDDILAAGLNPPSDTFDVISDEEKTTKIAALEKSIADRQAKLDAGTHGNPKAAVITQAKENKELSALKTSLSKPPTETIPPSATPEKQIPTFTDLPSYLAAVDAGHKVTQSEYRQMAKTAGITIPVGTSNVNAIAMLKNKLGEQNAIQQTNAGTSGVGAEVLGEPRGTIPPTGVADTGLGRLGVDGNQSIESTPQDRTGSEQPTLAEITPPVEKTIAEEVPTEEQILSAEDQTTIEDEAAAELAGEVTAVEKTESASENVIDLEQKLREKQITGAAKEAVDGQLKVISDLYNAGIATDTDLDAFQAAILEAPDQLTAIARGTKVLKPLKDKQKAEVTKRATTPAANIPATKEPKAAATTGKKTKAVKAAPVTADYLNSETFYGGASPTTIVNERKADKNNKLDTDPVNVGIINAGHEIAFDAFDTVDVRNGVNPELKAIAEKKNKEQRVKRQQMRKELSGKKDPETNKPYSDKRITALVSNIPLYKAGAPLEFLTKKELADIYRKYVGKRKFVKEEKTTREAQKQNRDKFVEGLNELQKIKLQLVEQRAFIEEVVANTLRKKQTTGADSRKDRVSKTSEELSKELKDIEQKDIEAREAEVKKVADTEMSEEKQLTQELKEFNKAAEKVLPKKQAPKEKPAPSKSKLVTKVENAIADNDTDAALDAIANEKINERGTRTIAQSFLKLIKDFGGITIQFNDLPKDEDGLFDPATNTIALSGKDGVYTGKRPIDETVMHEVGHYLIDHVVDNREAYLKSIKDPAKRKEIENALNRLDNNFRFVKGKLGDKFNIPTMKEFLAEIFGNTAFQVAVANIDAYKTSERVEGFTGPRKQFRKFEGGMLQTIVRNIANALGFSSDFEGVTFKEILDDVFKIVSLPTAELRGTEVSYAASVPKNPKQAPFLTINSVYDANPAFAVPDKLQKNSFISAVKDIFTHQGIQKVVTKFQNDRQAVKFLENQNIRAGLNKDYGPDVNNAYTQITLAPVRAMNKFYNQIQAKQDKLIQGIVSFAKTKEVIERAKKADKERKAINPSAQTMTPMLFAEQVLGIYGQAFTDVERRENMFVQTSPLENTAKVVPVGGKMITVADLRDLLLGNSKTGKAGIFDTNQNLTEDQARQLWELLESYVFIVDANGNKAPNPKYVVTGGYSPEGRTALDFRNIDGSAAYNVTGFTYDDTNKFLKEYENDPNKALLDEIFKNTWDLNRVALELNKESYYVSKPAANWIAAYGYQHYVPLKGVVNHTDAQQRGAYNFNGGKEKDLVDTAIKSEGRFSVSNNPVLQTMSDAMVSAMRAGKGPEYTLSIKNLIGKGITGRIAGTVPFNEKTFDNIKKLRKENTIFHHNEDGSIDVIEINDNKMLNSIRRTYKDENKFIEMANLITSGLGQMHTRYNVNFGPLNFVRDALTNAWNIGATLGPVKGAELITRMAVQIATRNSLGKAFQVARAYKTPNFEKYKDSTDPIYRNMYELIKEGGMVEYLEGISLKSNLEKLNKAVGRSRIVKTKEGLDSIVDVWTSMFEIASRAAAYGVLKDHYMNEMNLDEKAAKIRAASTTKNLANFEQVGEYGKVMGALYMFYRPSATGAVRAIESITPMIWGSLERAERNMPEHIKNDPAAKATYMDNYKKERRNAQLMTTVLAGAGALAYTMSYMMADTDDQERNKVLTDDMGQWTRFWRVHIPGFDKPFQIPWGFGLGAFAAMGAQLAAVVSGQQSLGSALKNGVTQIALDSFVPIPISRMDITDEPAAWFVDSLSPSFARPIVEFVANKNGLGQSIYNDATGRRMGDAYLGGDHVPETYKILTRWLAESTDGYIDWTPNSAYFLVNSYADGPARLIDTMVNNYYLASGTKEFDAKTDFPFIGSFIGAAPNIDTREFTKVEKQINTLRQNVNQFKANNPDYYYLEYLPNHPFDEAIVKLYDENISDLNELRAQDKIFRGGDFTLSERKELLTMNRMQQNFIKHNLVEMFKAYGIEP